MILGIPLYLEMVGQYEKYFPQLAYKFIATNSKFFSMVI